MFGLQSRDSYRAHGEYLTGPGPTRSDNRGVVGRHLRVSPKVWGGSLGDRGRLTVSPFEGSCVLGFELLGPRPVVPVLRPLQTLGYQRAHGVGALVHER